MIFTIYTDGAFPCPGLFSLDFLVKCSVYYTVSFDSGCGMAYSMRFFIDLTERFNMKTFFAMGYCHGSRLGHPQPFLDISITNRVQFTKVCDGNFMNRKFKSDCRQEILAVHFNFVFISN